MARLPMHRSDGPIVQGCWQAAANSSEPPAASCVQLIIKLPLSERIFGTFLLSLLLLVCLLFRVFTHPSQAPLIPISMLCFFTTAFVLTGRWSIRRAERHFQQALLLRLQVD
jgi:hypothetical protein